MAQLAQLAAAVDAPAAAAASNSSLSASLGPEAHGLGTADWFAADVVPDGAALRGVSQLTLARAHRIVQGLVANEGTARAQGLAAGEGSGRGQGFAAREVDRRAEGSAGEEGAEKVQGVGPGEGAAGKQGSVAGESATTVHALLGPLWGPSEVATRMQRHVSSPGTDAEVVWDFAITQLVGTPATSSGEIAPCCIMPAGSPSYIPIYPWPDSHYHK